MGLSLYLVNAEPAKEEPKETPKADTPKEEKKEAEPAKDGEKKSTFLKTCCMWRTSKIFNETRL